ncbi:MAG TPA: hypothetical protein DDW65_01630 [Firmicutes bacterium]|jgi:GrpB-like predicted nucleotidyltransferase (UPF0157 family)|nr:hypothetical protein [Bacillota bacterium]
MIPNNLLGLPSGKVKIVLYDELWKKAYQDEEKLLWPVIGEFVIDIQHIGSTSIPGLASKPIIDIAAFVTSLNIGEACIKPLEKIGYEYRYDAGVPGRHFFAKGSRENRTHFLHIEELHGELWKNHILFRDYLREHREAVIEYAELKIELAKKYENDRDTYTIEKAGFIRRILAMTEKELQS